MLRTKGEHLWTLVGMTAACQNMPELRRRMAERFGRQQVQLTMFVDPPGARQRALPAPADEPQNGQIEMSETPDVRERDSES